MLREVKGHHINGRLIPFAVTAAGASPAALIGTDLTSLTGSTGQVTAVLRRPFTRAPVIVAAKGAAVGANGSGYLVSAPTAGGFTIGGHAGGAGGAADGQLYGLALGWDSASADYYRARLQISCSWDRNRIEGFKVNTATPVISIGASRATIAKTGTGDVTLTFRTAFGSGNVIAIPTVILATRAEVEVTSVSASAVRIKTYVNGVATDTSFYLIVVGCDAKDPFWGRRDLLENSQRKPQLRAFTFAYAAPTLTIGAGNVTLVKTGTGDVAATFGHAYKREPIVVASPTGVAGLATIKAAATTTGVSIEGYTSGGVANDLAGMSVLVLGSEDASEY